MPQISIQKPTDQPTGQYRLLSDIKTNLSTEDFSQFRFIVAFAKSGPFLRLDPYMRSWRDHGKRIEAIFGIDEKGTTVQALERALDLIDQVYIVNIGGNFTPTFHPKIYYFSGVSNAIGYIGSNNFTVGGLETNFETLVKMEMSLPEDINLLSQFEDCWNETLAIARPLTHNLLVELEESGAIINESLTRRVSGNREEHDARHLRPVFPTINIIPPSSIPRQSLPPRPIQVIQEPIPEENYIPVVETQALVIQIVPHHNGEVFLSKRAIDQNPEFFGFPFSGQTVPKKITNPSYPQRDPDPRVNIRIVDQQEHIQEVLNNYPLNTVYYDKKSEIRITMPPNIIRITPPYSIMVMAFSQEEGIDYDILILVPGSQQYQNYLISCNQEMPSGGNATPRRFGWL